MNIMRQIKSTSGDHEDEFAHRLLTDSDTEFKGTFLDVACGNGRHSNNTFTLEEEGLPSQTPDLTTQRRRIRLMCQIYLGLVRKSSLDLNLLFL